MEGGDIAPLLLPTEIARRVLQSAYLDHRTLLSIPKRPIPTVNVPPQRQLDDQIVFARRLTLHLEPHVIELASHVAESHETDWSVLHRNRPHLGMIDDGGANCSHRGLVLQVHPTLLATESTALAMSLGFQGG